MLITQTSTVAFIFFSSANSLTVSARPGLTQPTFYLPRAFNFHGHTGSGASSTSSTIVIAASVAIGTAAFVLALVFCFCWRRINRRRRHHKTELGRHQAGFPADVKRPPRPPTLHLGEMPPAQIPMQMQAAPKAYLDTPRPRRTSLIARERDPLLSPLAASQRPGFLARPIPDHVPISVANSRPSSTVSTQAHLRHQSTASGSTHIPPEELSDLLEELSRHYVLADPKSPKGHRHRPSTSVTSRSRVRAYS